MARIGKDEHARILQMADHEQRKVTEIAAEYGCTPANIYALLAKLRRQAQPSAVADTPAPPVVAEVIAPAKDPVISPAMPDLFTSGPATIAGAKASDRGKRPTVEPATVAPAEPPAPTPVPPVPAPSVVTQLRAPAPARKCGLGAALAKPGMAVTIRTADGE